MVIWIDAPQQYKRCVLYRPHPTMGRVCKYLFDVQSEQE